MAEMPLRFKLNGADAEIRIEPDELLVDVLRDKLGMLGVKKGCSAGECGACTVILNGKAVNSCLVAAASVGGAEVETIEGLAEGGQLHPLQAAFISEGAVQCGYCTPGMILSAKALLDRCPQPTKEQVRKALAGNLCRCTGYVKIEAAVTKAAEQIYALANASQPTEVIDATTNGGGR